MPAWSCAKSFKHRLSFFGPQRSSGCGLVAERCDAATEVESFDWSWAKSPVDIKRRAVMTLSSFIILSLGIPVLSEPMGTDVGRWVCPQHERTGHTDKHRLNTELEKGELTRSLSVRRVVSDAKRYGRRSRQVRRKTENMLLPECLEEQTRKRMGRNRYRQDSQQLRQ